MTHLLAGTPLDLVTVLDTAPSLTVLGAQLPQPFVWFISCNFDISRSARGRSPWNLQVLLSCAREVPTSLH